MVIAVSASEAFKKRQGNNSGRAIKEPFYRQPYIDKSPAHYRATEEKGVISSPQAYIFEQPVNTTVVSHFHDTNQFQVFVSGKGVFGTKTISAMAVHYAGAHTPYGPIQAGSEGLHYFTLRNCTDSGAKIMPADRHKLRKVERVHRIVENINIPDVACLSAQEIQVTDLIPLEENGLGARQLTVAPYVEFVANLELVSAGLYVLVLVGSVEYQTAHYGQFSLFYRAPDESLLTLKAASGGASVLLLQFPPEPLS